MDSDSTFLRHLPCEACGSSDANGLYSDGHTHCFKCGAHTKGDAQQVTGTASKKGRSAGLITGEIRGLRVRKITDETAKHFGYMKGTYKGRPVHIAPYHNADGKLVAQHLRTEDKEFPWLGDPKEALPFGAHCWQKTGKKIVVTEGEIDALAMSQVQGNEWPVVSIGCGAGLQVKKYFGRLREYFMGFEQIVLMFDNDEPGREAAKDAAEVLGSRAYIAELPLKDASEMLKAGRTKELIDAMWRAKKYQPAGIVIASTLKEKVLAKTEEGFSWPWDSLTKLTYGRRTGELVCLGAASGGGKSDWIAEVIKHDITVHRQAVGAFLLEQTTVESTMRICGKIAKQPFHVPDAGWTEKDLSDALDKLETAAPLYLFDSFGINDYDVIEENIRYLRHSEGVRFFYIDHITALAAAETDERKALEMMMARLGGLVKELDIWVLLVSHLATPESGSHEEGARVMAKHLKGSRSIAFWCSFIFGMERNQQDEDDLRRRTTILRCLKDRLTGRATGRTLFLRYNPDTGMQVEVDGDDMLDSDEETPAKRAGFQEEPKPETPEPVKSTKRGKATTNGKKERSPDF